MIKRGEITTSTVVEFIILAIGFAVIVFFIAQLNWTGMTSKETCHQSVIFRGSLPSFAGVSQNVPLKCKTDKICITAGLFGGSCSEFAGMSGVTYIRVKDVHEVEKIVAQNILDCWSMMGEGKISVFSQYLAETFGYGRTYSSCVVCTRIAYDKVNLIKNGVNVDKMDVQTYMDTRVMPGQSVSYTQYLNSEGGLFGVKQGMAVGKNAKVDLNTFEIITYDVTGNEKREALFKESDLVNAHIELMKGKLEKDQEISNDSTSIYVKDKDGIIVTETSIASLVEKEKETLKKAFEDEKMLDSDGTIRDARGLAGYTPGNEMAMMFMQISAPTIGTVSANYWKAMLGSEIGTRLITGLPGPITIAYKTCKACYDSPGWISCSACAVLLVAAHAVQAVNVARSQFTAWGVCHDLPTSTPSQGCSAVRALNYKESDLKGYCDIIESVP